MKPHYLTSLAVVATVAAAYGCTPTEDELTQTVEQPAATEAETSGDAPERPAVELPSADEFRGDLAFAASISEGTINALNLETNEVAWTLKVSESTSERPAESAMGIAATRDGKTVFTGDAASDEIVIVDAETRKITKRIPVDHQVHAIDICPHDHWVYVSGRLEDFPWLSKTTVIEVDSLSKAAEIAPGLGYSAHYAFTPDGKEAWAASVSTNTAWVVDVTTHEVTDVIPLIPGNLRGASPEAKMGLIGLNEVAISPDGKRAYLVGPEAGTVFAVDVASRKVVGAKHVGERTHGVAVTRDGREVWTANNTGTVTILDPQTLDVIGEVDMTDYVDELPFAHVGFSVDGTRAYLSWSEDIGVIDVGTRKVVDVIDVGTGPHEISLEDFYVRSPGRVTALRAEPSASEDSDANARGTQTSSAGGVTVKATIQREGELSFELSLDTHSRDLMSYDIEKSVVVRIDAKSVSANATWTAESDSSHHRKGTLSTSAKASDDATVTLSLPGLAGNDHMLEWSP